MRYPIVVEGFEGHTLAMEMDGVFSAPRLLQDDRPSPDGPVRGSFTLTRADGTAVTAVIRRHMLDPVPQVVVEGRLIRIAPAFRWFEWVWILMPVLLILLDPILGALLAAVGISLNAKLMRMERPLWQRAGLALLVFGLGLVAYFPILTLARLLLVR